MECDDFQNVRVGNTQASLLQHPGSSRNVYAGCQVQGVCDASTCVSGATCVDEWKKAKCLCPPGNTAIIYLSQSLEFV